ncbi:unnamed protein product, partial [Ectocarpus sp. 4 AP-2014]
GCRHRRRHRHAAYRRCRGRRCDRSRCRYRSLRYGGSPGGDARRCRYHRGCLGAGHRRRNRCGGGRRRRRLLLLLGRRACCRHRGRGCGHAEGRRRRRSYVHLPSSNPLDRVTAVAVRGGGAFRLHGGLLRLVGPNLAPRSS